MPPKDAPLPGMRELLRALVSQGVCEERPDAHFVLTELGGALRAEHPHSIRAWVILNVEVHHGLWARMLETAKSGDSASVRVFGLPFYEYLASNRVAADLFDTAMSSPGWALQRFRAAIEKYDFGRFDTIVDVGGGNGAFLVEVLASVPRPGGIVFDVDRVGASAVEVISSHGLASRCRFGAGKGRIRTFGEFRTLLADAGFNVTARIPALGSLEVIEARQAGSNDRVSTS